MKKEQNLSWILFAILIFMLGLVVGMAFDACLVNNSGIPVTSYCKEIQIDTLQYDYKQNMYKFTIKLIK